MEVLITGGNGLLGHHLVDALQQRGAHVRVLTLPGEDSRWLDARGVAVYSGDIRQRDAIEMSMRNVELVFNLAGMMGQWRPLSDYRAVNVTGAENVCRAALKFHIRRLVHVSSWTVYGMATGYPSVEDSPLRPFPEPYAISKTEGDRLVQSMIAGEGLPAVIVRPGTFFGPKDHLHFARMADRVRGRTGIIVGSGRNALPFVYVTDVVQGLLLAAEHPCAVGRAYNITNDHPLTQEEFLRAIAEEIGAAPPRVHVPYALLYSAASVIERSAVLARAKRQPLVTRLGVKLFGTDNRHSIARARRELGYRPAVGLRQGIQLAAQWYLHQSEVAPASVPSLAAS